ncbi:lung adenoma susceptibility protein 2 [Periophthalmus magnuspinnatus]|uniref:lung adenoma susceptibility protein 2 n=1 Tax=Periophthalmus magnuspinnatus TaxID=409849 RepID=UPI002436A229|nr:lung adenoma susceptibility protein 2 [Periophthalmus magnuspinnatus]
MRSSLRSVDALSPESTVTSLLSGSGHLTSSLQQSLSTSFTYKDKEYESASAALDAYITDFERSRDGNTAKGEGLGLPLPSTPRTTLGALRNRDVLRERLSEQELDFLTLPVSSLRHRDNRDRVSMTTDELLNLPNDGSMPITHTSAFLHGLASKSGPSQIRSPVKNTCSQSHAHRASSQPMTALHCSRCGGRQKTHGRLKPVPETPSSRWAGPASAPRPDWLSGRDRVTMHLPHWLSSNKAALDCSDVHSLPDLPYPPWIQHCDAGQSECSLSHRDSQSERVCGQRQPRGTEVEDAGSSAPSWVRALDEDQLVDSEETLRTLRLQFAEHISQMVTDRSSSVDSLYRDRRIESLIQKADRVLDSLQNSASGSPVPPVSSDQSLDLQLRDLEPLDQSAQPGPLEAVKQILFRLEAVETELHRRQDAQQGTLQQGAPQQGAPKQKMLQDIQGALQQDRTQETVTLHTNTQGPEVEEEEPSLQRALHHLSRLKLLVEKPEGPQELHTLQKHRDMREEEEEERDEGRFSS